MATLTQLPQAPSRSSDPTNFIVEADAFLGSLPTLVSEMNSAIVEVDQNATKAQNAADSAAQVSGAVAWKSGAAYAKNDAAISQVNFQTYRAKVAVTSTTDPANDAANWAPLTSVPPINAGSVRGLKGDGPDGSGASLFMEALSVVLRNSSDNIVVRHNTGRINNIYNLDQTEGAINRRDQAIKFALATDDIHFYFIWNGSTLATISSLSGPNVGPTLPAGYTHWAYATTKARGSNFIKIRGNKVFWSDNVKSADISSTTDNADKINFAPTIAQTIFGHVQGLLSATSASLATCTINYGPKGDSGRYKLRLNTGGPSLQTDQQMYFEMENIDRSISQYKSNVNGSVASLSAWINVHGFTVPNGDS